MTAWIIANLADIIVGSLILAAVFFALRHIRKRKKNGQCVGCSECGRCGGPGNCVKSKTD